MSDAPASGSPTGSPARSLFGLGLAEHRARLTDSTRLAALDATGLVAAGADAVLDRLARTASRLLGVPVALVSLVDGEAQHFAGLHGLGGAAGARRGTPLSHSFCQHVVASAEALVVADAGQHPVLQANGAYRELGVVAYAGVPLTTHDGDTLGAFCAIDTVPREWTDDQVAGLRDLASAAVAEIELRLAHARLSAREAALRESEARFRAVFEHAAVGVTLLDDEGVIVDANAAFADFLGAPRAEIVGTRAATWSPAEDADITRGPVAELRAGRAASVTVEKRFVRRDGAVRWASLTISRLTLGDGRPGILGVTSDISERRAAEAALARERAFLGATLESLSDGIVACDAAGTLTLFNRAARECHGIAEEQIGADHWAARYALFRADGVTPLPLDEIPLRRAFRGEPVQDAEMVIAPAGQPPRTMRVCGRAIRDAAGHTLGAVVAMRDVTDQVRATRALAASEAQLRAALEGGRFGFVVLHATHARDADPDRGPEFVVASVNGQAAAMIGMPAEDLVGQHVGQLLPLARQGGHLATYARVLATGRPEAFEVRVRDPRFTAAWLRIKAVPLADPDPDGGVGGARLGRVALLVRDVSEQVQAARELQLLTEVTHALAAAPDLHAAAGAALGAMCAATGWDYGEAWFVAGDRLVHGPVAHAPADARLARFAGASRRQTFARGDGLPGRAWADAVPVAIPALDAEPDGFRRGRDARAAGLRSSIAVPVLADGAVVAVLTFLARDPRRAHDARATLLAAVAAQVGGVVQRKLAEAALAEREARLGLIYDSATDLMFLMRVEPSDAAAGDAVPNGAGVAYRCESVNAAYRAATGLAEAELVGRTVDEILPPDAAAHAHAHYARAVTTGDVQRYDEAVDLPGGRLVVETTLTPVHDAYGRCTHLLGAARDVSAARRAAAAVRESEARYRGVLENLRAPAVQLDAGGGVTFINDALLETTGWARGEVLGTDWFARFVPSGDTRRAAYANGVVAGVLPAHEEHGLLTRDGTARLIAWDQVLLRDADGRVIGAASVGQDVTERRAMEARLAALSEHDELTGLLNRRGFRALAAHTLKSAARTSRRDAVLYVDLDRFKPINDTYGHAAGDEALRGVAQVIRATVRDADFGARLGGDEFVVYSVGMRAGDGQIVAARLRANLDAHNAAAAAQGRPFRVDVSVGVAELEPGDDLDALLARGDAALYVQKFARREAAARAR